MSQRAATHPPELCARFHRASELIGRRWTGAIIFVLLKSRCRFATLRDAIPDITDRMLSDRLQELEAEGIVERTVIPETPVRVDYALTKKGRALATAVDAIADWAHRWTEEEAAKPRAGNSEGRRTKLSAANERTPARDRGTPPRARLRRFRTGD
jgi:DNA-binding HxlR family transcriptional regulator